MKPQRMKFHVCYATATCKHIQFDAAMTKAEAEALALKHAKQMGDKGWHIRKAH